MLSYKSFLAFLYWFGVRKAKLRQNLEFFTLHSHQHSQTSYRRFILFPLARLNRATQFLEDLTTTLPEMRAWFGWKAAKTVDPYIRYSGRHIRRQRSRLKKRVGMNSYLTYWERVLMLLYPLIAVARIVEALVGFG
jgi:hypothetical protein